MDGEQVQKSTMVQTGLKVLAIIIGIVLCITVIGPYLTNQKTYEKYTLYLDEKMANANMLALGASSASFVVSMLPDDTGTAISNELADFTGYLLFVISAIFLEKYLLVTIGWVGTAIAVAACLLFFLAMVSKSGSKMKFKEYAIRTLIFSICIVCIIPAGCVCGQAIEDANAASIQRALEDAREANNIVEAMPAEEDRNFFQKIGDFFAGLWDSAKQAYEWAKSVLNNFMSSIAVMIVTTIALPILMLFAFLWAIKFLTKHDFVIAVVGLADRCAEGTRKALTAGRRVKKTSVTYTDEK